MSIEEAIKDANASLVDVREASELENEGSVDGAIHIPLGEIPQKVEELQQMSKPLVLFCRSGNRSGKALEFLKQEGLTELYNGGGFRDVLAVLRS